MVLRIIGFHCFRIIILFYVRTSPNIDDDLFLHFFISGVRVMSCCRLRSKEDRKKKRKKKKKTTEREGRFKAKTAIN